MKFSKKFMLDQLEKAIDSLQSQYDLDPSLGHMQVEDSMRQGDIERVLALGRLENLYGIIEAIEDNRWME